MTTPSGSYDIGESKCETISKSSHFFGIRDEASLCCYNYSNLWCRYGVEVVDNAIFTYPSTPRLQHSTTVNGTPSTTDHKQLSLTASEHALPQAQPVQIRPCRLGHTRHRLSQGTSNIPSDTIPGMSTANTQRQPYKEGGPPDGISAPRASSAPVLVVIAASPFPAAPHDIRAI